MSEQVLLCDIKWELMGNLIFSLSCKAREKKRTHTKKAYDTVCSVESDNGIYSFMLRLTHNVVNIRIPHYILPFFSLRFIFNNFVIAPYRYAWMVCI